MARVCEICGSRRWRKSAAGLVSCEEGHVLQNYRQEESQMDEPSQYALKKRTIRKNRQRTRQRREVGELDENQFRGPAKEYLKLELLQLLLRHQLKAVQEIWDLSNEIEVARDVWLLVISLYPLPEAPRPITPNPDPSDPFLTIPNSTGNSLPSSASFPTHLQYSQSARSQPGSALRNVHLPRSNTLPDLQSMAKKFDEQLQLGKAAQDQPAQSDGNSEDDSGSNSGDDDREDDDAQDQEDDNYGVDKELIEEMSDSSESSLANEDERENEPGTTQHTGPGRKRTDNHSRHGKNPGANKVVTASTVLKILIISLWIMRVPVLLVDVMRMPDYNVPHVLWRLTKELGGTRPTPPFLIASLYLHTFRLLQNLDLSMTIARPREYSRWHYYNTTAKEKKPTPKGFEHDEEQRKVPPMDEDSDAAAQSNAENPDIQHRPKRRLPNRRLAELCPVELRLASAIIVVLKLVYGLDGETRQPASWDDLACEFPAPSEWLHEMRLRTESGWFRRHTIDRNPIDFAYQSPEGMDEFLARASKVLLGVPNRTADSQQVIGLFDLNIPGSNDQKDEQDESLENWREFHRRATPNVPNKQPSNGADERTSGNSNPLSGHSYKVYDWKASEEDLPDELRLVVHAVADTIGVTRSAVLKELYALEVLVQNANRKARGEVMKEKRRRGSSVGGRSKSGISGTPGASSVGDTSD
ncbi:hypothetical protein QFC19_001567 [Naganishia cerealis]|uniref:Uncharacterized protein n=1 Tax=Naganishia cerealis TaxID=610337 RepID=A0ACC2WHZ7_9TREE|nr:hypothetical protein QFC19_001567 [Naganishia cerealis]